MEQTIVLKPKKIAKEGPRAVIYVPKKYHYLIGKWVEVRIRVLPEYN